MSKGTIVYIGGMEMPDGNAAAHRALNNSKIFRDLGYEVVFVGVDRSINSDCYEEKSFGGFKSFPSKYPTGAKEWIKRLLDSKHIEFVLDKFSDLKFVVCYNMHALPLSRVIKYCKKRNAKVVADATEWYGNEFSLFPVKFIKWLDTKICMTKLQKKVDGMIAISEYLYDYYKGSVKNIIKLPPLVDTSEDIWAGEVEKSGDAVEFIYAGQPGKDKDDLGFIVEAFSLVNKDKNYKFKVIGCLKDEFLTLYPEKADCLNKIGDRVEFVGRLSHEESVRALRESDYSVFIREKTRKNDAGFPTKFAECVTAGVGIIASDVSNISDYFPLSDSCLLKEKDVGALAEYLGRAIENGKKRNEVKKTFDYRNFERDINDFLNDCEEKG